MKSLLLFLSALCLLSGESMVRHHTINGHDFTLITESYDLYDSKGSVMKFYRDERNGDLIHLFNLTLHDGTGSCSDKSLEDGSYEINGSQITLYTFWDRRGKAYEAPYGARIIRYTVEKDGSLVQRSSRIYVETSRKSADTQSGMRYLFMPARTSEEKQLLQEYIMSVQKRFKGTFVTGDEAQKLKTAVREALRRKSLRRWQETE